MRRLPVLSTVARTYKYALDNLPALAVISRRWAIAAAAAFALSYALVALDRGSGSTAFDRLPLDVRINVLASFSLIIRAVATYVIIVRWHRLIILHADSDKTRRAAVIAGILYFSRLALLGVAFWSIVVVGALLPITLAHEFSLSHEVQSSLPFVIVPSALLAAILGVSRLSLILPAGAIGDFSMSLRKSWAVTRGNSWRMLGGSILSSGPAMAANLAVNTLAEIVPRTSASALITTINLFLSAALVIFTGVIQASFLSYAYLFFRGEHAHTGS